MKKLLNSKKKITLNLDLKGKLFSPGGSFIYGNKAMRKAKRETIVVYLKISLATLEKRITNLNTRGIVGLKKYGLKALYKQRSPLYRQHADIIFSVENEKPEAVKKNLLLKLKRSFEE